MLNGKGEFLNASEGEKVLLYAESGNLAFSEVELLGKIENRNDALAYHIEKILELPEVNVEAIKRADFKVVVDPDVDRLAIICEDGSMFGEEYTLVAVSDYYLRKNPGNTVSNLSSSRALKDLTLSIGGEYSASAVGEVNVVAEMKKTDAVIGGEGNGGVILPALHYGRDALVGVALFLSHLAIQNCKVTELKKKYPVYEMSKNKIELSPEINVYSILEGIKKIYSNEEVSDIDGVKIDFEKEWVHLRKSNTEPIIRIYSESSSKEKADKLATKMINEIKDIEKGY
jgi:phosphomannomutase